MNEDVGPASELDLGSLDPGSEEAHLLRSPANARRLLAALGCALNNEGEPVSVDDLRRELTVTDEP